MEWEAGLPNVDDLPPLSHLLISPELASAFNITPEPHRSMTDVTRASHKTLSTLQGQHVLDKLNDFTSSSDEREDHEMVVEGEDTVDLTPAAAGGGADESFTRTSKRIRLVWTPQLHKRFVEVVKHLGVKKAVPKTIMQLMNVEGLTRENVASHLQKYRLYVKTMPGLASKPDRPVVVSRNQNRHALGPISMPYMVPMTYPSPHMVHHHGFEYHSHPYNMMMQPKDWFGNNFGLVSSYQQGMATNDR